MARKLVLANNPLLSGPAMDERARVGVPYREVRLDSIDRDPNQPRVHFDQEKLKELSQSIKRYGILSPLIVQSGRKQNRFQLIAGERRFRAAKMAGLTSVPVLINKESERDSGEGILSVQLVENLQRTDLTPLERAHAIGALKETYNLSIRQVAERLGVSKGMVQRSLEILELPDDLLNALREGASESKILLLAKIEDEEIRASYLKDLDTLTRQQIKHGMDGDKGQDGSSAARAQLTAEDQRIVDEIQLALGMKIRMTRPNADSLRGRLSIDFYSDDDLQEIFRKLISES